MKDFSLLYIHDPMCSWCYGYKSTFETLIQQLPPAIDLQYIVGGLAADTQETMPVAMQLTIQTTWQRIEQTIPGVEFNHDFWKQCTPRRSTYAACRAVIAAQQFAKQVEMIETIQNAYYQQARNPSDYEVLYALAEELAIDRNQFIKQIHSEQTENTLQQQITFSRSIGADSMPSLFLYVTDNYHPVVIDYNNADISLEHINSFTHHE